MLLLLPLLLLLRSSIAPPSPRDGGGCKNNPVHSGFLAKNNSGRIVRFFLFSTLRQVNSGAAARTNKSAFRFLNFNLRLVFGSTAMNRSRCFFFFSFSDCGCCLFYLFTLFIFFYSRFAPLKFQAARDPSHSNICHSVFSCVARTG